MEEYIIDADVEFGEYVKVKEKLIRCKDCKRYIAPGFIQFDDGTTNLGSCSVVRGYVVKIMPDCFCAWGERKEVGA